MHLLKNAYEQNLSHCIGAPQRDDFFSLNFLTSCCPVQVGMTLAITYHIGSRGCTCTIAV